MFRRAAIFFAAAVLLAGPAYARKLPIDKGVKKIARDLRRQIPDKGRVWISDVGDLDDRITYFGRFLSDKIQIALTRDDPPFAVIDRRKIDLTLTEFHLQRSGLMDEETLSKAGAMLGATHVVHGTVTDMEDRIDVNVKIRNIETGETLGGASYALKKTRRLAKLVRSIIKSERDKGRALDERRAKVLAEIEADAEKRMAALKEEEDQKRAQLDVLDKDMRAKSITIQEYEKKKAELENKERRIKVIHSEIDRLNREIPSKLKIGMRREDVAGVMEIGKPRPTDAGTCHMAGRYFLIFEGDVLRSVVAKGSVAQVSTAGTRRFFKGTFTIENCEDAALYGKNVAAL